MQYEIEVIHRNRPAHRFTLTITVETDMKQYLQSNNFRNVVRNQHTT